MSAVKNLMNKKVAPVLWYPFIVRMAGISSSVMILYALDLHASLLEISLMRTIGATTGFVVLIPLGILSDRFGRRRMLLVPEIMLVVAELVRVFATTPSHLLAASFFGAAGGGWTETLALLTAMAGDLAEPHEQTSFVNTVWFCSSLGMLTVPAVASVLLLFTQIKTLIYISFFARIGIIFYILFFVKEPQRKRTKVKAISYKGNVISLLKKKDMIAGMSITVVFFTMGGVMGTFGTIFARTCLFLSDALVTSLGTFRSITLLSFRFFSNEIISRTGYKKLIILMFAIGSLAIFAVPYSTNYQTLLAIQLVWGLCFGALAPSGAAVTGMVADASNRGLAQALNSLATASGQVTPVFLTPMAETLGISSVFNVGALVPFVGIFLVAGLMTKSLAKR